MLAPEGIPKESKPSAIYDPPFLEAERQECGNQRQKARGHCSLGPKITSPTKLSRLPVTNHIFLGFWTDHIGQECHNLRSAFQKRHIAHLGLCPCGAPGKPSSQDWAGA